jgi:hypothetical protein
LTATATNSFAGWDRLAWFPLDVLTVVRDVTEYRRALPEV